MRRPCLGPMLWVCGVMIFSWAVYNLSWRIDSVEFHRALAAVSGTLLFLSVAFGAPVVYILGCLRGARRGERIAASLATPFLWATKECMRLCISFHPLEALYYYLNPLNLWLAFGVTAELALAEVLCRRWRKGRGEVLRVLHPVPVALLAVSLLLVVGLYAWGEGENVYALFLSGYRLLFGAGLGVDVPS